MAENDEITINLRGLTADQRINIIKALDESTKLVPDEINQLALIQATHFHNEETPDYLYLLGKERGGL